MSSNEEFYVAEDKNVWKTLIKEILCNKYISSDYVWHQYQFYLGIEHTAQKMKFLIKDFFSKCDQILSLLPIWSDLLKKSLMENFIFCAVAIAFICDKGWFSFIHSILKMDPFGMVTFRKHFKFCSQHQRIISESYLVIQNCPCRNNSKKHF